MKKNCNIIRDLLPLYIDDVCSAESKTLIEDHIKDCNECENYFEELKESINTSKTNEINVFKNFVKKINFKILRNAILITILIIMISIPILHFINNYKFTLDYDENMEIIYLEVFNRWGFQFNAPISGRDYAEVISYEEDGEKHNIIFITRKYVLQDYLESKKDYKYSTVIENLDYKAINPQNKMQVYYTTEDLKNIKTASEEELKNIIDNSKLIFTNDEKSTSTINCNLDKKEYNYTLTYYSVSKQIIESIGDNNMPDKLLKDIYSINGDYRNVWFDGDKAPDIFKEIEDYMKSNGGSCKIENLD